MATEDTTDNIFSGLKVVAFASFIAGPSAAVILSDFGADVVKVEPPKGEMWRIGQKIPPQPNSDVPYPFQLANRNKRSLALDLKSPEAGRILERLVKWADVFIVNTPHPARKKLKLTYEDVVQWNPRLVYADITGYGEKGPDADLPGFDLTAYWARTGLLSMTRDAGAPPTWPVAGSGDNATRSEEHTSELQSPYDIVCRLLLEKKKQIYPAASHREARRRQVLVVAYIFIL